MSVLVTHTLNFPPLWSKPIKNMNPYLNNNESKSVSLPQILTNFSSCSYSAIVKVCRHFEKLTPVQAGAISALAFLPINILLEKCLVGEIDKNPFQNLETEIGKIATALFFVIGGPIMEECLYRGLYQKIILQDLPKKALNKIDPDKVHQIDRPLMKVARTIISSLAFASPHLSNAVLTGKKYAIGQTVMAASYGIVLGLLQESKGLKAPIVAHIVNNLFSYIDLRYKFG